MTQIYRYQYEARAWEELILIIQSYLMVNIRLDFK